MEFLHIPKTGGSSVRSLSVMGKEGNYWGHYPIKLIPEDRRGTVWSVIRNPYDRAVSIYAHASRVAGALTNKRIDKAELKKWWLKDESYELSSGLTLNAPMADFLTIDGVVAVPTLIDISRLDEFFFEEFGVKLPIENISIRKKDYKEYYDDELREFITNKYKQDLELFNYEW